VKRQTKPALLKERMLFSDCGGVCADPGNRSLTLKRLIREMSGDERMVDKIFPPEDLAKSGGLYVDIDTGRLNMKTVWARTLQETGITEADRPYGKFLDQHLQTITLIGPVLDLFRKLEKKGLRITIVSNGDEYTWHAVKRARKEKKVILGDVFVSQDHSAMKPELLEIALRFYRERGVDPEVIFVEDRHDLVLEGVKLGLTCVLFDGLIQPAGDLEKTLQKLSKKKKLEPCVILAGS